MKGSPMLLVPKLIIGGILLGFGLLSFGFPATVDIDNAIPRQKISGFGATHLSLVYGINDVLTSSQRMRMIQAVYGKVRLNLGNVEGSLLESPGDYSLRSNDNADPDVMLWSGFQKDYSVNIKNKLIDLARPLGFTDFSLAQKINVRWASPWLNTLKASNYAGYLAETAEQVAAGAMYNRDSLGMTTPYIMLFNEPLNGNSELQGSVTDMVNIIKAAGARLRKEGFATTKFIVPNSEKVENAIAEVQAILADSVARSYVGVLGYHCYPYGSNYASVPKILATSGQGTPVADEIAKRNQLSMLARQYDLPLWMTEVSHSEVGYNSFDALRGRAIHIHDEFLYAGASAYFGMNNMWDETSQQMHFGNNNLFDEGDGIALFQNSKDSVHITSMGYAIGHYARWISSGAVMLPANSSDNKIQVSAFRDNAKGKMVLVVINNNTTTQSIDFRFQNLSLATNGIPQGEQSTAGAYWNPITPIGPEAGGLWKITVPGLSVTSLSVGIAGVNAIQKKKYPISNPQHRVPGLEGPWIYPNGRRGYGSISMTKYLPVLGAPQKP